MLDIKFVLVQYFILNLFQVNLIKAQHFALGNSLCYSFFLFSLDLNNVTSLSFYENIFTRILIPDLFSNKKMYLEIS